jgi:hypothetical protein
MYLLAREITGRRDAAFLAGLIFAFAPMRALHVSHLQVLAWGWMPIALWGLHRFLATLRGSPAASRPMIALAVFVAAFTAQAFSNSYFLYYLSIASAFVVVYELTARTVSTADRVRALGWLAGASAIILICVGTVAWAYVSVRSRYGFRRPYDDWSMFSANLRSYVSAPDNVRLWGTWLHGDEFPERQLFPGLVALIAAAAAIWPGRGRRRAALLYGCLAAAALVLSLGPEPAAWSYRLLPSGPYLWLARLVPGMDGMRVPARLGVVVLMALSVLAALGFARVLARLGPRARAATIVLAGLAVFAEGWAAPLRMAPVDARGRPDDRSAYRWLAQQPQGGAIELPILEWSIEPTLTYQYATLFHAHPIVNGYSGYGSPLQEFLGGAASPLNDLDHIGDALDLLRDVGVRYVLVHPRDYEDAAIGAATAAAIGAQPGIAAEAFRADDVVAFRLSEPAAMPPSAPARSGGVRLGPGQFRATASDASDRLPLMFDGDGDTRWLTGRPQNGDEWIRLEFDRPRDVTHIDLETAARSFGDYPRELRIESTAADGSTKVLAEGAMLIPYGRALAKGGARPALSLALPTAQTRVLTIRQIGRTRRWFWSLHELAIYAR